MPGSGGPVPICGRRVWAAGLVSRVACSSVCLGTMRLEASWETASALQGGSHDSLDEMEQAWDKRTLKRVLCFLIFLLPRRGSGAETRRESRLLIDHRRSPRPGLGPSAETRGFATPGARGTRGPRTHGSPDARGTRNGRPYAAAREATARRLNGAVFPGRGPGRPPLPRLRAELPTQNCLSWRGHAVAARLPEAAAPTGTPAAGAAWARLATEPGAARPCAARGQTKDQLPPPPAHGWSAGGPSPSAPPGS